MASREKIIVSISTSTRIIAFQECSALQTGMNRLCQSLWVQSMLSLEEEELDYFPDRKLRIKDFRKKLKT